MSEQKGRASNLREMDFTDKVPRPPPCPLLHVDNMPGIYDEPKIGPCCAHCGGDLGVRGPLSEPIGEAAP